MRAQINSFLSDTERDAVIELSHSMHREHELSYAEGKRMSASAASLSILP